MKIQGTMFVVGYLILIISLIDDDGKPVIPIMAFVFATIFIVLWFWYLE